MKTGLLPALGLIALVAGCTTVDRKPAAPLTGNIFIDGPAAISNGPPRDKVLWQYRTAAAAMRAGDYEQAKHLLDDAILTLNGIYGKDKDAKKARSNFHEEAKKTFIGEPYERVMAYYYRGILYWMAGEPDNARACFRSGQLADSSVEEKYSGDYVLLDYLDGLATSRQGGDGSDALARSAKLCTSNEKPPAYDPQANVLLFLEFGRGPTKYATGKYHEELHMRVPPCGAHSVTVKVDDQTLRVAAYDDLGFQATTRGGRVMDHVLGNKAVFKTTTATVGTAAIVAGLATAAASHNQTAQEVGLGVAAAGVVVGIISMATTPAADVRSWDNLPRYLSFTALRLSPGQHAATVEFLDANGNALGNLTKSVSIEVPETKGDKVFFVSDRSKDDQPLPTAATDQAAVSERVRVATESFDRAAHQMEEPGISQTFVFRTRADLSKAQAALVRAVSVGDTKWRIMNESSPDADTILVSMIGKQFLGVPRRATVQLCQLGEDDLEIRARLMVLPTGDELSRPDTLQVLKQEEARVCRVFKASLERELGTPVRTATD